MLEKVDRASMLLNALRLSTRVKRFLGSPIWFAVSEVCCVGSYSAIAIASEIGLDPHAKFSAANLAVEHRVQPTPLSLSSAETLGDNSRRG